MLVSRAFTRLEYFVRIIGICFAVSSEDSEIWKLLDFIQGIGVLSSSTFY